MSVINKFYFINVPEGEMKKFIEETITKAEIPKVKKTDMYKEYLRRFNAGEGKDLSLRQYCIENHLPYQSVINARAL